MSRVAVITGASSGIGEAIALKLARQGMHVVLAARRGALLEEVAQRCRAFGVEALVVETDVTDQDDVEVLSQAAVDEFGSYDIWINNAAVTIVGRFTDISLEMFRQVIETNFFGYVYGANVALQQFQAQEHGTLINISSVFGVVPSPYETPYVASKFAIRGFAASLRQELELSGQQDIHVCTVLPAAIDTPIYRNAANISGLGLKPPGPIYPVEMVADAVAEVIENPQAEVTVGAAGRALSVAHAVLPPQVFERLFGQYITMSHFTSEKTDVLPGNIFEPGDYEGVSGNWRKPASQHKNLYIGLGVAGLVFLMYMLGRRKRGRS